MKHVILILSILFYAVLGNPDFGPLPEWEQEELSLSEEVTTLEIFGNETEYSVSIASVMYEKLVGNERYSIYVLIEEMTCSTYTPSEDGTPNKGSPNYLLITSDSSEIPLAKWTICNNITQETQSEDSEFNNGINNLGLHRIKVKAVGEYWSPETSNAKLRVELKKHKLIQIGDEMKQTDLNLIPEVTYVAELNKNDDICKRDGLYHCSLSVIITQMGCNTSDSYLEVTSLEDETPTTVHECKSGITVSNTSLKYESTDKILLRKVGEFNVGVSVNYVLSSPSIESCPEEYFDCNYQGVPDSLETRCIPMEWHCDGRPNCPGISTMDESSNYCRTDNNECWFYEWETAPVAWVMFILFIILIVMFAMIMIVFRYVYYCLRLSELSGRRSTGVTYDTTPPPTYTQATATVKGEP